MYINPVPYIEQGKEFELRLRLVYDEVTDLKQAKMRVAEYLHELPVKELADIISCVKIEAVYPGRKYEGWDCEYAAFVWNKRTEEYEQTGKPVMSEVLCRNRFNEYREKGWFIEDYDTSRVIFKKRTVATVSDEWEEIKEG